jgi:hypothetical protein
MLNMKVTLSAMLLAAAVTASAQTAGYRGTFELSTEARFGKVILQPGSYTVSTLQGAKGIRISGENKSVAVLAAGNDINATNNKPKLVFVESNGVYTLQSFESGALGQSYEFLVTKSPRVERASVKPATIEVGLQ